MKTLIKIQKELKAPKNQFNKFGNYHYRSCEDILEAVKPLLGDAFLTVGDEIVEVGGRVYVKATATLVDGESTVSNSAFAREEETKKGMDGSQITGSASSYARKYALNGLFLIDDVKDADTQDNKQEPVKMITDEQFKKLTNLPEDRYSKLMDNLSAKGIKNLKQLTFEQATKLVEGI